MEEDAHNPASEHQSSGVYASPMQRQRNAKQDKGEGRSQKGQSQLRERPCQQNNDGGVDAPQGTPLLPRCHNGLRGNTSKKAERKMAMVAVNALSKPAFK
jgi:hypothetical protein